MGLVLAMILALTACGGDKTETKESTSGSTTSTSESDKGTATGAQELTFVLHNEPDGIDPNVTSNSFASPFLTNCFEGLVTYDEKGEIVPGLAEKWEVSEDGKTYTFTLREGLKWSDGTPLTSQDFLYSIQRVLIPETTAQYVNMVTDYVVNAAEIYEKTKDVSELGVTAPDDKTLVINLKAPTNFFVNILAMQVYSPVQKATIDAKGDQWTLSPESYVTSGPFKISEMNMGESVVLVKNENYYDAENVKLEKITFRYILDQSTALSAFESNEIDGFREIPAADLVRLKAESDDLYTLPQYGTTYYLINCSKEPYNNPKVRQALNLAIDRKSMIDNILQGTGTAAFSLVSPGYSVDGKVYEEGRSNFGLSDTANVEEAKKLLAEAGYPNGEGFPAINLSYYTNPQVKPIAEAIAQMLKDNLGVEVNISTEEWKVYYDNVQAGNYEVAAMGWGADYLNPMTFLPLFVSNDPLNNAFYSNPDYDAAVNAAKIEPDPLKSMELMRAAEDVLMKDYPFMPLYYRSTSLMMKPYVQGWYLTQTNSLFLKNVTISK